LTIYQHLAGDTWPGGFKMVCKEVISDYKRLKSIKAGLLDKAGKLEALLTKIDPGLLDKILLELESTREAIRQKEKEVSGLERDYKFLKVEAEK